jgi:hypothetical protein
VTTERSLEGLIFNRFFTGKLNCNTKQIMVSWLIEKKAPLPLACVTPNDLSQFPEISISLSELKPLNI